MTTVISVVIPVYNSQHSLEELHDRLVSTLDHMQLEYEIIMIDDNSWDDSYRVMKAIQLQDARMKTVHLTENWGQHAATLCGIRHAYGDVVITMDDDLQHPSEVIPVLLRKLEDGFDAVFAVAKVRQHSRWKKAGSSLVNFILSIAYDKSFSLRVSSYRALSSHVVKHLQEEQRPFIYLGALILDYTDKIANVSFQQAERKYGESNYSLYRSLQLALKLLIYYSYLPVLLVGILWIAWLAGIELGREGAGLNGWETFLTLMLMILTLAVLFAYIRRWMQEKKLLWSPDDEQKCNNKE